MSNNCMAEYLVQIEATKCLECYEPPCQAACPAGINVPGFINRILTGDWRNAARLIWERNSLPAICAVVCPQKALCVGACLGKKIGRGPNIGALQYYAIQKGLALLQEEIERTTCPAKVAVVGAGPSGLACAADLAGRGHVVTVFEKESEAGGCLVNGIPEHRLAGELAKEEITRLQMAGIEFRYNQTFGIDVTLDDIKEEGFRALFIGTGLSQAYKLAIPGEDLSGVFTAKEILEKGSGLSKHLSGVTRAAVIGGGNVAMDAATVLKKAGIPEVFIVYRRSQREMPAWREEIQYTQDAGVTFELQSMPVEIIGTGHVEALKCRRTAAVAMDQNGRWNYKGLPGTDYIIPVQMVVTAIGNRADKKIGDILPGVNFNHKGQIEIAPETMATSKVGIFAGGDVVADNGGTVVKAMADGRRAAKAIIEFVEKGVAQIG